MDLAGFVNGLGSFGFIGVAMDSAAFAMDVPIFAMELANVVTALAWLFVFSWMGVIKQVFVRGVPLRRKNYLTGHN